MPKRKYGTAFGSSSGRRTRSRTTRARRRIRPYRQARRRTLRRTRYRARRRGWRRQANSYDWPARQSTIRRYITNPGADFHHYTWRHTYASRTINTHLTPIIELTGAVPRFFQNGGAYDALFSNAAAVTPVKVTDYNLWAFDYPKGESIILKDTVTTVRIIPVYGESGPEFPIEVKFVVFRSKQKVDDLAHVDVCANFLNNVDNIRESNRERFEVKTIRTWRPKDVLEARNEKVLKFKVPVNRVQRTQDGRVANNADDWNYDATKGWFLMILHNDQAWADGQWLNFEVTQRITWIGQDS